MNYFLLSTSKLPAQKLVKIKGGITMTTTKSRQFRRRGNGTAPCSTVPTTATTATITATARKEPYRRPRRGDGCFGRR